MANNVEITILLDFYGEMLTQKQRDFLGYYYNDDLSLSEIAENEGITRQGVRDAIKRAETLLYEMESKLGSTRSATICSRSSNVPRASTPTTLTTGFPARSTRPPCASNRSRWTSSNKQRVFYGI